MALGDPKIPIPDAATRSEVRGSTPKCVAMKSVARAKAELGIEHLPDHVAHFGQFMLQQSRRFLGARDVIKAYTITRSSVQRSAITGAALRQKGWPDHTFPDNAKVRPEDAFSRLLMTPMGKRYLDAAERGFFDVTAMEWIVERFRPFSMANALFNEMHYAVLLGERAQQIQTILREGTRDEWIAFTREYVYGIGAAKTGFIASLLGRGDIPTGDAREMEFWWKNREAFTAGQQQRLAWEFVRKLDRRLAALQITVPPDLQPFYQHLVHHAVWDAVGRSATTHSDVSSCMLLAGAPSRRRR